MKVHTYPVKYLFYIMLFHNSVCSNKSLLFCLNKMITRDNLYAFLP
jgi:hypothetical protein